MSKPLHIYGEPDEGAVQQIENCMEHDAALAGALMADHHLGYSMPIGGVIAYEGHISPSGVGYDIACGNKAVRLDCTYDQIRGSIGSIMDDIYEQISFGVGRKNSEQVDHELFDDPAWKVVDSLKISARNCRDLKQLARQQLGTVGSGNHYVDLFVDEEDRVWVGVHFGSRGMGHKIATHFVKAGEISREMMMEWVNERGVELRGAGTDESPHCYKRLDQVLEAQSGTIEIKQRLRPIGVAMAGENEFDPYKD